jgi:hypothetical protein
MGEDRVENFALMVIHGLVSLLKPRAASSCGETSGFPANPVHYSRTAEL